MGEDRLGPKPSGPLDKETLIAGYISTGLNPVNFNATSKLWYSYLIGCYRYLKG